MKIDITAIKENDTQYGQNVSETESRYKCDWDDAVHDSYGVLVKQLLDNAERVRNIRCKAETLQKEVEGLDIDALKEKADVLCKEAESI